MRQASLDTDPRQALRAIGRAAQEASTLAEDVYLGLFGTLDGTGTGELTNTKIHRGLRHGLTSHSAGRTKDWG